MIHPFLQNKTKTLQYISLWIAFAALQSLAFAWIIPAPFEVLLLDSFTHALIFGSLGLLIWSVVKYGNFEALTLYQRLVNHVALALLTLATWLGVGNWLFYLIFDNQLYNLMLPLLPLRAFIGLLIYLPLVQQFRFSLRQTENEIIATEAASNITDEITTTSDNSIASELLERIAVKSGSKIHVVMIPDIVYLQADGDYVQIFTMQGKYLKEQTMKFFEEHLPNNKFVRVHRSFIVNVEMISRIELYEKQSQQLTLKNGQQIKTSPNGYKALRIALNL